MSLISRYEHLNKKPHHEEAERLLLKVSSLVKPIMQSHKWKVGTLAEMFPDNPSLLGLNVNRGFKILLRLRPHQAPDTFYEVDQLVLVMLHELTHNVHSPHDASFYKLLGELEEEWYGLKRKGYSGEGFHSDGARLGGSYHAVPEHIGRIKALEAAERRRVKSTLMGKGGRLGGAGNGAGVESVRKSPREMAVEAAERRLRDEKSCSHDSPLAVAEAAKAAAQSMGRDAVDLTALDRASDDADADADDKRVSDQGKQEHVVIDLVSDDGEEPSNSNSNSNSDIDINERKKKSSKGIFPPALADTERRAKKTTPRDHAAKSLVERPAAASSTPIVARPGKSGSTRGKAHPEHVGPLRSTKSVTTTTSSPTMARSQPTKQHPYLHADGTWTCPTCTLNNDSGADRCAVCEGLKPIDEAVGWRCEFCYGYGNEHGRWMCLNCGAIRKHG